MSRVLLYDLHRGYFEALRLGLSSRGIEVVGGSTVERVNEAIRAGEPFSAFGFYYCGANMEHTNSWTLNILRFARERNPGLRCVVSNCCGVAGLPSDELIEVYPRTDFINFQERLVELVGRE